MILESIVQQHRGSAPLPYAPVCKEWQAVIEKKNFGLVKLRASDLNTFERKMRSIRLRGLVKHIWLNILLHKYDCSGCEVEGSYHKSNDMKVKLAISKLFSILSSWEPTGKNLILEISAQSPSDSKHWFKNLYFGAGGEDEDIAFESGNELEEAAAKWHDPKHGWLNGQQVPLQVYSLCYLFSTRCCSGSKNLSLKSAQSQLSYCVDNAVVGFARKICRVYWEDFLD